MHLTSQLATDGFAVVRNQVSEEVLASLRGALATVMAEETHPDILRGASGVVRKITYPLAMDDRFLVALADPAILGLALAISPQPEELVLTWEDVLYKAPRVGEAVPVHQDLALQSLPGPVYSLGIHLDDARDNPVWFLPGSHRLGPLTAVEVKALKQRGGFTAATALAGDIVIHDVLCVHYSEANIGPSARSTWNLEFRTLSQLARDARWPASWARRRRAILFHACSARERAGLPTVWPPLGPGETRADWLAQAIALRVPHVGGGVDYDLTSPWYHFAGEDS